MGVPFKLKKVTFGNTQGRTQEYINNKDYKSVRPEKSVI